MVATTANSLDHVVLVVDDEKMVLNALARYLRRFFPKVVTATTPLEAESALRDNRVTHLVCDHWLGPGLPLGIDLVSHWKNDFPSIQKVVLLTGADVDTLVSPPGLDSIIPKTIDPTALTAELRGTV